MFRLSPDDAILDWTIEYPASIAVFERHGIDYCCGGKSLQYACEQAGVALEIILNELRNLSADS